VQYTVTRCVPHTVCRQVPCGPACSACQPAPAPGCSKM
jgi:hypothetical protein